MITPFIKRAPTLESLRERATNGVSTWLFRLAGDRRFRGLDWSRASLVHPGTDPGVARSPGLAPRQSVSTTHGGSR